MWRLKSIITPMIHSLTEGMKPALAWVTSTPWRLAAGTSMLRMSMAQRTKASSRGSAGEQGLVAHRLAVGNDDLAVAGQRGQLGRERSVSPGLKRTSAMAWSAAMARSPK